MVSSGCLCYSVVVVVMRLVELLRTDFGVLAST